MLSGCVPVVFEAAAALTQWPLHWSVPEYPFFRRRRDRSGGSNYFRKERQWRENDKQRERERESVVHLAESCVEYVPRALAMRNMTAALEYLVRLSGDTAYLRGKLLCIARVGHRMQYSVPQAEQTHAQEEFNQRRGRDVEYSSGKGADGIVKTNPGEVDGAGSAGSGGLEPAKDALDVVLDYLLR
jgi:hypothetical protein